MDERLQYLCTRLWVISSPCCCCIVGVGERIFGDGKGGEVEADGGLGKIGDAEVGGAEVEVGKM